MTGLKCAVACCKNNIDKTKGTSIQYHRFPKNEILRKIWVKKCQRKMKFNEDNSRICSIHFQPQDFEIVNAIRSELMNTKLIRKLKSGAIPSLYLTAIEDKTDENLPVVNNEKHVPIEIMTIKSNQQDYDDVVNRLLQTNAELEKKLSQVAPDVLKNQKQQLEVQILKKEIALKEAKMIKAFLLSNLNQVFTKCQIDKAILKKKKISWTLEDIQRALTIRYLNVRCYLYLKKQISYPLPRLSILKKWVSKIAVECGLLKNILMFLEIASKKMSALERVTIIQFDEMKVNSLYEYNEKTDEVNGPYNYMQTIMIRGLFSNWQQPIYVDFDKRITSNMLLNVIKALHDISFDVVACVSGCGNGTTSIWEQMNISMNNTSFLHPVTQHKVHFFTDVPSLFKLIRYWLLDTGFEQPSGEIINEIPLKSLVKEMDSTFSAYHELTEEHFNCKGPKKKNLLLTMQLLSHATANVLIHHKFEPGNKLILDTANFIELISSWFSIANSYDPESTYGVDLSYQDSILDQMNDTISNIRCVGRLSLKTFQKAIIITNTSMKSLLEDMRNRYNVKQILTCMLNMERLENFFSEVSLDCNSYPDPICCLRRIRDIMYRNNVSISCTDYLVNKVLRKSNVLNLQEEDLRDQQSDICQDEFVASNNELNVLPYLTQHIAEQFAERYSHLILYKDNDHDYIVVNSKKGSKSMKPSPKWLEIMQAMEKQFQFFHKNEIKKGPNVVGELVKRIAMNKLTKDIPQDLIECFVMLRMKFRINYLNKNLQCNNGYLKRLRENTEPDIKFKLRKVID